MTPTYDPARIRQLVLDDGRPHREIAAAAGMGYAVFYRIIAGDAKPRADTLARILAALGRSWTDLDSRPPRKS